jgi:hypothetical protein
MFDIDFIESIFSILFCLAFVSILLLVQKNNLLKFISIQYDFLFDKVVILSFNNSFSSKIRSFGSRPTSRFAILLSTMFCIDAMLSLEDE